MMNADLKRGRIRKSHPACVLISAQRSNTTAATPAYYKSYSINLRRYRKIPGSLLFSHRRRWLGERSNNGARRRCMPKPTRKVLHPSFWGRWPGGEFGEGGFGWVRGGIRACILPDDREQFGWWGTVFK